MKNIKMIILVSLLALASLSLISCAATEGQIIGSGDLEPALTPEPNIPDNSTAASEPNVPDEPVGLANPASVYCEEQGGTLEIRTDDDGGQYGVCVFEDGRECEEWAFFRGECGKVEEVDGETAVVRPSPNPPSAEGLTDKTWILQSYTQPLLPDATITIEFTEAGELHGTAGCNSYFGSYVIEGNTLTVGAVGQTEMWCEGLMDQETTFLELLQNAAQFELTASTLTIHAKDGDLIFATAEEGEPASLEGTKWMLNSIVQGDAVSSARVDESIYIQFTAGQVQGNSGCNGFSGGYVTEGDALTFSELASTAMACDEEHNQREAEFMAALGTVTGYHIEQDQLILTDEAGNGRLFFTAAEPVE